jgi:predicted alpha/beta superfamily hydrolase
LENNPLEIETFDFESLVSGNNYSIHIGFPPDYTLDETNKYPVIFILDADWNFNNCLEVIQELMEMGDMPKAVLIGIGYTDEDQFYITSRRKRDFYYPQDPSISVSGGGENFSNFIQNELIPYLDDNYHIDPSDRTLIGHSAAGYFALYTLFKYRSSIELPFKNYITISPAIYYYDSYILDMEDEMSQNVDGKLPFSLFLTAGDPELDLPGFAENVNILTETLKNRDYVNFRFKSKDYDGKGHGSVIEPSIKDGLSWIFREDSNKFPLTYNFIELCSIYIMCIAVFNINMKRKKSRSHLLSR